MSIDIEKCLQEYIYNLCEIEEIFIDCRFRCYGDVNRFYANNKEFTLDCVEYYVSDIEDIKKFFAIYLSHLWEYAKYPNHRIALYVHDIVDMDGWYNVIVGGCLFEDVTENGGILNAK